ncbi:MAG: ABC transporter ATP-binding protein/permease [Sandaracinaceae bacterium]|nr:ABC transporter ATP-binding protein/permease [Sandaracinaceae bacterium]
MAPPLPAESSTSPRATELLVDRILSLTAVSRPSGAIHDAVVQALALHERRLGVLEAALGTLGVRARTSGALAEALGTVGETRPLVLETKDGSLVLVTGREGGRVCVEPMGAEARWVGVEEVLASAVADGWLFLDPAMPLGTASPPDAAHHGHPTPRQRLLAWISAERHDLVAIVLYAMFIGVFTLTLPIAVQALVSTVALGTLLQPLVVLTALLLGALVFAATLRAAQSYLVEILQRRIFVRIVADLSHRLPRVARAALDRTHAPELLNRFFDTFMMQKTAATLLLDGLEITLTISFGMLVLAFYHPVLLAFDVVLVVVIGAIVVGLGRRGTETAIAESQRKYATAAWLEEIARHDSLFKLGGGLEYAELRAEALARDYLAWREKHFGVVFRQTLAVLALQALANAAVLGIGGVLVIGRQLSLGQLVAAELIVTVVVGSLAKIGKYLETYYDLLAAIDKVGHLTDLPVERAGGASCASVGASGAASLRLDAVRAGYSDGPEILRGVSLTIRAGERVGITGPTGAGKSLLVELVAALREPTAGRVLVDELDLRDLDLAALREKIAVVRSEIISGSILENVRLGRARVDAPAVRRALAQVGLLEDVDAMPEGLRTELTASGEPLSSSQKCRLAIARAIAGEPVLLVLDDALDGLDPRVREPMLDALFAPARPWTLLVTSTDPSVLARCERVLGLHDGLLTHDTGPR